MIEFDYYQPTRIVFKINGVSKLLELVRPFGTRTMLVMGQESMEKQGVASQIRNTFEEVGLYLITHGGTGRCSIFGTI